MVRCALTASNSRHLYMLYVLTSYIHNTHVQCTVSSKLPAFSYFPFFLNQSGPHMKKTCTQPTQGTRKIHLWVWSIICSPSHVQMLPQKPFSNQVWKFFVKLMLMLERDLRAHEMLAENWLLFLLSFLIGVGSKVNAQESCRGKDISHYESSKRSNIQL